MGRFLLERPGFRATALTADSSIVSAIANDCGYEHVFARQLVACARHGDVLFAISTSGLSRNIVLAAGAARERGVHVIGLTGERTGDLAPLCDVCLRVPSRETPRIQEAHILVLHIIAELLER